MCWIYNILWTITKFFLLLQPQILISRKFSNNIYEIIDPPYSASIKQWFLYSLVFLEQATHWLNIPPHPLFSHSYYVWSLAYLNFIVIISSIDTWHFYIGGSIALVAPGWGGGRWGESVWNFEGKFKIALSLCKKYPPGNKTSWRRRNNVSSYFVMSSVW